MSASPPPPPNRLLEALLRNCKALHARIEPVSFPVGHTVYVVGQAMTHVYFPTSGVLSILVQLENGESAECLSVGNEGFIGLPVWLGQKRSIDQVIQQAPGETRRISARAFCDLIEGSRGATRLLKHFAAYSLQAAYRGVVCNTHHSVSERVCRWILATADRARSSQLQLSHALLAHMLGVQRPTVTDVASGLKREGVLSYRRAAITILDRHQLERRACECYRVMNELYAQLVAPLL
ncbi:MAG TPA: Crp/Fnr family transcriptional regulator [Steroidobacteraceae bacterium]|nr:Crp/Fnr family transcriptional regulator [Steroidobacteraceae bacterium]